MQDQYMQLMARIIPLKQLYGNAAQLAGGKFYTGGTGNILPDFRKVLIDTLGPGGVPLTVDNADTSAQRNILSLSPSYIDKNRTRRVEDGGCWFYL